MSRLILAAISDLFFRSKLNAQATALDLDVRPASPDLAPQADLAIVHLASPGVPWEKTIKDLKAADPDLPIIGFGQHTEGELFKQARSSGCDKVVANSVFSLELQSLLQKHGRHISRESDS